MSALAAPHLPQSFSKQECHHTQGMPAAHDAFVPPNFHTTTKSSQMVQARRHHARVRLYMTAHRACAARPSSRGIRGGGGGAPASAAAGSYPNWVVSRPYLRAPGTSWAARPPLERGPGVQVCAASERRHTRHAAAHPPQQHASSQPSPGAADAPDHPAC